MAKYEILFRFHADTHEEAQAVWTAVRTAVRHTPGPGRFEANRRGVSGHMYRPEDVRVPVFPEPKTQRVEWDALTGTVTGTVLQDGETYSLVAPDDDPTVTVLVQTAGLRSTSR